MSIRNDNLPTLESLLVPEAAEQSIFNDIFFQNGLCYRWMEQSSSSRTELLLRVEGGVYVIPNQLHISKLFIPKKFIKEVVIPQTNKNVVEGGQVLTCV